MWLGVQIAIFVMVPAVFMTYQRITIGGSIQATGFWLDNFHAASIETIAVAVFTNITGFFSDAFLYLGFNKSNGSLTADPMRSAPIWAMGFVVLGQIWSIGVEIFFYAIAPLTTKSLLRISVVFFLSASGYLDRGWAFIGNWIGLPSEVIHLQAPKFLWMFMVGSALARTLLRLKASKGLSDLVTPFVVVVLMYVFVFMRRAILFPEHAFPWWLFAALTAALPILFTLTSSNRIDKFIGDLSYPVYLNHLPVIQIFGTVFGPNGLAFTLVSCGIAVLMVLFVDRPLRRFKFSASRRSGDRATPDLLSVENSLDSAPSP